MLDFNEEQAKKNYNFLRSFYGTYQYNDWSVTVAFYTALHLVDLFIQRSRVLKFIHNGKTIEVSAKTAQDLCRKLADKGVSSVNGVDINSKSQHMRRNIAVNGCQEFDPISFYYTGLYSKSRSARYENFECSEQRLNIILQEEFNPILEWSNDHLGMNFALFKNPPRIKLPTKL